MSDDDGEVLNAAERRAADRVLVAAWGPGTAVEGAAAMAGRPHVVRLRTASGRTAILKRPRRPADSLWGGEPEGMATEWATLAFLAGTPGAERAAPRLLGGDADQQLFVMEELPAGRSLAHALLDEDGPAAEAGLVAYATALGRLHAATLGRRDELVAARAERGLGPGRSWWATKVAGARDGFVAVVTEPGEPAVAARAAGGVAPSVDALEAELDVVERTLDGAEGPAALVHGDPCPDNVLVVDGHCWAFDFERAGWGSVAADAAYLLAPFPSCWCFATLPTGCADAGWAAYMRELAVAGADLSGAWDRALAAALAAYVVTRVARTVGPTGGGIDEEWGTATMRPRLRAWAAAFLRAPGAAAFPTLRAAVAEVDHRLVGEAPAVAYPALPVPGAAPVAAPEGWSA